MQQRRGRHQARPHRLRAGAALLGPEGQRERVVEMRGQAQAQRRAQGRDDLDAAGRDQLVDIGAFGPQRMAAPAAVEMEIDDVYVVAGKRGSART